VSEPLEGAARHAFTTRGFDEAASAGQAAALAALVAVEPSAVVRIRQLHGTSVVHVATGAIIDAAASGDAIVSTDPFRAVAVAVADCVPVLLADRDRRVAAAVHAGWRGTAAGVVPAAIAAVARAGVRPDRIVAAIGPSIGPCCYQVDEPVRAAFDRAGLEAAAWFRPDGAGHWTLDLWEANRRALVEAGVPEEAVHVARLCTFHEAAAFHSYRRDGAAAGRMFAAIRLTTAGA
jgi:YfiH family protein